jgi:hypothetical protein
MEPSKHQGTIELHLRQPMRSSLGNVLVTPEDVVHLFGSWPVPGIMLCSPLTVEEALEAAIAIVNDEDDDSRVQPKTTDDDETKPPQ